MHASSLHDKNQTNANALTKSASRHLTGSLSPKHRSSSFRVNLTSRSRFSAFLTGLKANADLTLLKGNTVIAKSSHGGTHSEAIHKTLDAGTYTVRVSTHGGKTRYRLKLSPADSSPIPSSPDSPGSGSPGSVAGNTQMFYSDEFGYESLPSTMSGLSFLEASGVMAFFGDSPDLSNFLNAVYAQFGDAATAYASKLLVRQVSSLSAYEPINGRPDRLFVNSRGETNFIPGFPGSEGTQPSMETIYYPNYS